MPQIYNRISQYLCYATAVFLVVVSCNNSFFWDTIQLGSAHATFFFNNGFNHLLPDAFDSGHIPAFGAYIASVWKLFGRSLIVSHLSMLPFVLGIVYQLHRLCARFIDPKYRGVASLLIMIDPTLLAQMMLVSPDVPLVFFFLMGINAALGNRKQLLCLSILLLFLVSMRGMMISVCLLLLDLYCNVYTKRQLRNVAVLARRSLLYMPALLVFIAYNYWHYTEKGWIGFHQDSPWADSFEEVGFTGFLYNIGILGWRILDFGRVGVWLVFFILLLIGRKHILSDKRIRLLLLFFVALVVILPINMLWAKSLLGHRYLLPIYLTFSLLCAAMLFSPIIKGRLKIYLSMTWAFVLLSGNFWIYPQGISQGWDASLANAPYNKLRQEALVYLGSEKIDFREVKSFFPNTAPIDLIDLNSDARNFDNYSPGAKYVFYSNLYNQDKNVLKTLAVNYKTLKHFESYGVFITIYRLKE